MLMKVSSMNFYLFILRFTTADMIVSNMLIKSVFTYGVTSHQTRLSCESVPASGPVSLAIAAFTLTPLV